MEIVSVLYYTSEMTARRFSITIWGMIAKLLIIEYKVSKQVLAFEDALAVCLYNVYIFFNTLDMWMEVLQSICDLHHNCLLTQSCCLSFRIQCFIVSKHTFKDFIHEYLCLHHFCPTFSASNSDVSHFFLSSWSLCLCVCGGMSEWASMCTDMHMCTYICIWIYK